MSRNAEVAGLLEEIAELLEYQGIAFKPVAYRRAAQNIAAHKEDIERVAKEGRLHEVPGVGASIAQKIAEYLDKGKLPYLDKLRKDTPQGMGELMGLPGLGPKRIATLTKELNVRSLEDLQKALKAGKVRDLAGFGMSLEQDLIAAIERRSTAPTRVVRARGAAAAEHFIAAIRETGKAVAVAAAGSLRRGRDTIGDLDIVVAAKEEDGAEIMRAFTTERQVKEVAAQGPTKASVYLYDGFQVDLRVVTPEQYGAALVYFTGSKAHNVALRKIALKKGLTLNEYALSQENDGVIVAAKSEEDIYRKLGLAYVPPEMREDVGEIELAAKGTVPLLIERSDITADLHTHTTESDGHHGAEEMIARAIGMGIKVYGVSDHSKGLGIARGLDAARYRRQRKELDGIQEANPEVLILQGAEANIGKDGNLDIPRDERQELDYIIGSIHSAFTKSEKEQTQRILRAIEQGIDILGHPLGRQINRRDPIRFDEEKVFTACAENGVLVEIDGQPDRQDLPGELVRKAKDFGCRFTTDSDAHSLNELAFMDNSLAQARRGWLEAKDVVSTYPPAKIQATLGRSRRA
jgi:DNA polymerase (family X)